MAVVVSLGLLLVSSASWPNAMLGMIASVLSTLVDLPTLASKSLSEPAILVLLGSGLLAVATIIRRNFNE
jgi:hypothetical protein